MSCCLASSHWQVAQRTCSMILMLPACFSAVDIFQKRIGAGDDCLFPNYHVGKSAIDLTQRRRTNAPEATEKTQNEVALGPQTARKSSTFRRRTFAPQGT